MPLLRCLVTLAVLMLCSAGARATLPQSLCSDPAQARTDLLETPPATPLPADSLAQLLACEINPTDGRWLALAETLLNAGAALETPDQQGRPPLLQVLALAASGDDSGDGTSINVYRDMARLLLARGADPLAVDNDGTSALHLAVAEPDAAVTELLLDLSADPLARDTNNVSALGRAAGLPGNLATFERLLAHTLAERDPDSLDLEALARRALTVHDHGKLNLLLQLRGDMALDPEAMTMTLAVALWQGAPLPVAQRLQAGGADVRQLHDLGGGDLAWRLASQGRPAELDWLLEAGFELNRLPDSGFPPLYFAHEAATELLLQRGADVTLSAAEEGSIAASLIDPPAPFDDGGKSLTREKLALLLAAGYPPDLQDPQQRTALEHAVRRGNLWLAQHLLNAGADPTLNSAGLPSLLPLALIQGRVPLIQLLLRHLPDHAERHPRLLLDYLGQSAAPNALVVETLLVAGAPTEVTNRQGDTPLLVAARRQWWSLATLMLDYGANGEAINHQGCTLRCFEWAMPDDVHQRLAPWLGRDSHWRPPAANTRPLAFFTLALTPALAVWLLALGVRLQQRRRLLPPTLWLGAALVSTVLGGGALFFDCQPCVASSTATQLAISAGFGLVTLLAGLAATRARREGHAPTPPHP